MLRQTFQVDEDYVDQEVFEERIKPLLKKNPVSEGCIFISFIYLTFTLLTILGKQ